MQYTLQYWLAWIVGAVGVVAGAMATASQTPYHPSWLTNDVAYTAGLVSVVCVGLGAILPQVQRTPGRREGKYVAALAGQLPDDLQTKHPTGVVSPSAIQVTGATRLPPDYVPPTTTAGPVEIVHPTPGVNLTPPPSAD